MSGVTGSLDPNQHGVSSSIDAELSDKWRRGPGIFVVIDARGIAGERIHAIQQAYDPKLANYLPPHLTLAGSSGIGPIDPATPRDRLHDILAGIATTTAPMVLHFKPPHRFMQTDIVVLPLDHHGPLRDLHERIATSGLSFQPARFAFTPHVTLSFFRTLTRQQRRELLAVRLDEPLLVDHLRCSLTAEPLPPRPMFELPLSGER
ncbi:MAG: 2'-5' RNA ligase family protein [Gemmatimonadaceae bacterium]|nr:2'-5' RNA ligase family protein [Gemmatimonadaceae bacterium]